MSDISGGCDYVLDPDDPETWGGESGDECYVAQEILNSDGIWTCPHDAVDGHDLCLFHLPLSEKRERVLENRFIELLETATADESAPEAPLQFVGGIFGSVELTRDAPDLSADAGLYLSHARFDGGFRWFNAQIDVPIVTFSGADFDSRLSFDRCEFDSTLLFEDVRVSGSTTFERAEFGETTVFEDAHFEGRVSCEGATFGQYARFDGAVFEGKSTFEHAEVPGILFIRGAEFHGPATFEHVTVGEHVYAKESHFQSEVAFESAEIGKSVEFESVTFDDAVEFEFVDFGDVAIFQETVFNDEAVFNYAEFADANFSGASFEAVASFSRVKAEGSDVGFRNAVFDVGVFVQAELSGVSFKQVEFSSTARFSEAELESASFVGADLSLSNLERANLTNADLFDTNLSGARLYGARLGGAMIDTETVFDEYGGHRCVYDPHSVYEYDPESGIDYSPDDRPAVDQLTKAMNTYYLLEQLTRQNTLPDAHATFFTRRQDMRRLHLRRHESFPRCNYWFAEAQNAVFRHGESFSRVVGWSLGTIVAFALVFPLGGWVRSNSTGTISYGAIGDSPLLLWKSLHHSTLLFLTGGGPLTTTGTVGEVLTTIEALIAPILLALLVFVLGRRAAR